MNFTKYQCPFCKKMNHGYSTEKLYCVHCERMWVKTQKLLTDF